MPKRVITGLVRSAKMTKTRVVEVPRTVRHPIYGKLLRKRTVCYVHDENNVSNEGDLVEIEESPPLSKTKRWKLLRVVKKAEKVDVAAARASRRRGQQEAAKAAAAALEANTEV